MTTNFFGEDLEVKVDRTNLLAELENTLPFNKKRIDAAKIKTSIHLVVANLVHYRESSVHFEHFSNRYKVSPHRSFKTERRFIELLKSFGYLDYYRALSNKEFKKLKDSGHDMSEHMENGKHRLSSMWLTDKGKDYFSGVVAGLQLITRRRKRKITKKKRREYDYFPFQEDELEELQKYALLLLKYNEMMSNLKLQYVDAETGEIVEFDNDCRIIFTGDTTNKIYDHRRRGGRYVSAVSYMWKQNRLSITIDGKRTVEIDYKCCLPSILFGKFKVGISGLEHDLYYVPGEQNCDYMRQLAKTIVVCMLGVQNEYRLKLALKKKFDGFHKCESDVDGHPIERFFPENFEFEDIERVIDTILERYRSLCLNVDKALFQKELATNIMQGIEARIATRIMVRFVQAGKPILCIHDSFRVLEDDEDLLYSLMEESYRAEVGMPPLGLKIDRQSQQNVGTDEVIKIDDNVVADTDYYDIEDRGNINAVESVEGVEYFYNGMRYRFDDNTGQDYVLDDSGLGLGWIAQGNRSAYDLHLASA